MNLHKNSLLLGMSLKPFWPLLHCLRTFVFMVLLIVSGILYDCHRVMRLPVWDSRAGGLLRSLQHHLTWPMSSSPSCHQVMWLPVWDSRAGGLLRSLQYHLTHVFLSILQIPAWDHERWADQPNQQSWGGGGHHPARHLHQAADHGSPGDDQQAEECVQWQWCQLPRHK